MQISLNNKITVKNSVKALKYTVFCCCRGISNKSLAVVHFKFFTWRWSKGKRHCQPKMSFQVRAPAGFSWVANNAQTNKLHSNYSIISSSESREQVQRQLTGWGREGGSPNTNAFSCFAHYQISLIKQLSIPQVSAFLFIIIFFTKHYATICMHSSFICNRKDAPSLLVLHECGERWLISGYTQIFFTRIVFKHHLSKREL